MTRWLLLFALVVLAGAAATRIPIHVNRRRPPCPYPRFCQTPTPLTR